MASPERRCSGCRTVRPQGELIRLTLSPVGSLALTPGSRGVYLCPAISCAEKAVKTKGIARGLRAAGLSPTSHEIRSLLVEGARRKIGALLGLARRAAKVIPGRERVEESLTRGKAVVLVLVASDAPEAVAVSLRGCAERQGLPYLLALTKGEIGRGLGRADVTAVGITDRYFAEGIKGYARLLEETVARETPPLGGK